MVYAQVVEAGELKNLTRTHLEVLKDRLFLAHQSERASKSA